MHNLPILSTAPLGTCSAESGTCHKCQGACQVKPGWFMPGEAEKVAEYLGLSLQELFDTRLTADWWEAGDGLDEDTFLLSPGVVGADTGTEFPANPEGKCVFFTVGRCDIHAVKPFECREHWCGEANSKVASRHLSVATAWTEHQGQIEQLLGREPEAETYYGGGLLGSLLGWRY